MYSTDFSYVPCDPKALSKSQDSQQANHGVYSASSAANKAWHEVTSMDPITVILKYECRSLINIAEL